MSGRSWMVNATAELDLGNFAEARAAIEKAFGAQQPANNRRFKSCNLLLAIEGQLRQSSRAKKR